MVATNVATSLRGNTLKAERTGIQHTHAEKQIDQGLSDDIQFVEANLKSKLHTSDYCGSFNPIKVVCKGFSYCVWNTTTKKC